MESVRLAKQPTILWISRSYQATVLANFASRNKQATVILLTNPSRLLQATPIFIDFDLLIEQGLLDASDVEGIDFGQDPTEVDYAKIFEQRRPLLEKAVEAFLKQVIGMTSADLQSKMQLGWNCSLNTWPLKNILN